MTSIDNVPKQGEILFFGDGKGPYTVGDVCIETGRFATLISLQDKDRNRWALKLYNANYRIEKKAPNPHPLLGIKGLKVLKGEFLQPEKILPDWWAYSYLMPWIEGKTWITILVNEEEQDGELCLKWAKNLAKVLFAIENKNCALTDISAGNIKLQKNGDVELLDAEDMFVPGADFPSQRAHGATTGYRHPSLKESETQWHKNADRFGGGVLICEILGWRFREVRENSFNESYFDQKNDLEPKDSERRKVLREVFVKWDPRLGKLFDQLMDSRTQESCPSFAEWNKVIASLPVQLPKQRIRPPYLMPIGASVAVLFAFLFVIFVPGEWTPSDESEPEVSLSNTKESKELGNGINIPFGNSSTKTGPGEIEETFEPVKVNRSPTKNKDKIEVKKPFADLPVKNQIKKILELATGKVLAGYQELFQFAVPKAQAVYGEIFNRVLTTFEKNFVEGTQPTIKSAAKSNLLNVPGDGLVKPKSQKPLIIGAKNPPQITRAKDLPQKIDLEHEYLLAIIARDKSPQNKQGIAPKEKKVIRKKESGQKPSSSPFPANQRRELDYDRPTYEYWRELEKRPYWRLTAQEQQDLKRLREMWIATWR